jgi:tetratricopeptide (TPR) repeat protein
MAAFFLPAGRSGRGILIVLLVASALLVYGHTALGDSRWLPLYESHEGKDAKWDDTVREGLELFGRRRFAEAAGPLRKALDAGCTSPVVLYAYGYVQFFAGKYDEAAGYFPRAEKAAGRAPEMQYIRFLCFWCQGHMEEADGELSEALAFYERAKAVQLPAEEAEMDTWIQRYVLSVQETIREIGSAGDNPKWGKLVRKATASFIAVGDHGDLKKLDAMRKLLDEALRNGCDEDFVHGLYGVICQRMEDAKEAEPHLLRAEELFGQHHPDHHIRGTALEALGKIYETQMRYEEAMKCYRKALQCNRSPEETVALQKEIEALGPKMAARDKIGEPEKPLNLAGADADKLLEMARQSAKAQHMADAVRYTQEAVRLKPDSPKVLAEHLSMLLRAKDFIAVEQAAAGAVDLAIKQDDPEALYGIMNTFYWALLEDSKAYDTRATPYGLEPPSERIKALAPLNVAERALRSRPDDPRLVLVFLRIHQDIVGRAEARQVVLEQAPKALREAHRRGDWETACLVGMLYFRELKGSFDSGLKQSQLTAAKFNAGAPLALFETFADAALHLEKEDDLPAGTRSWPPSQVGRIPSLATAYAGLLLLLARDHLQDSDFSEIDKTVKRFRGLLEKAGTDETKVQGYIQYAEDEMILRLIQTGDERLIAKGVELARSRSPGKTLKETAQALGWQLEAQQQAAVAQKLYAQYGTAAIQASMPTDEEDYTYALGRYRRLRDQLASIPDDMAKRAVLNREAREICDGLIMSCFRTNRSQQAVEYAEWFQGWAMRDLLGTRALNAAEHRLTDEQKGLVPDNGAVVARANNKEAGTVSGQDDSSTTRDLAVEGQLAERGRQSVHALGDEIKATESIAALRLQAMREMLDNDTTLVFCRPGYVARKPPLYGFTAVVTRSDFSVHTSENLSTLTGWEIEGVQDKCKRFNESLRACGAKGWTAPQRENFQKVSRELYTLFIGPVRDKLKTKRLVIVPSDDLFGIPFELLLDENGHYLGEQFAISYAPSATVLDLCLKKHQPLGDKPLILANPALADPTYALRFAEEEARQIRTLYPAAKCYVGSAATKAALRAGLNDASMIHIASHAIFDMNDPMASFLMLARDETGDGVLTATDIMGLRVNAQLVTLSACDTGRGEISPGRQEVIGLLRAWMFAGAPTVVVSLWKLDDRATSELMAEFYKNLKSMSRSESLQQAQLVMMKKYENPYYWGAFVLYGDYR